MSINITLALILVLILWSTIGCIVMLQQRTIIGKKYYLLAPFYPLIILALNCYVAVINKDEFPQYKNTIIRIITSIWFTIVNLPLCLQILFKCISSLELGDKTKSEYTLYLYDIEKML